MADTPVTLTKVALDKFTEPVTAATSISAGDTAVIDAGSVTTKLLLEVNNTTNNKKVTIEAGVGPRAALGDLVLTFADSQTRYVAIESARFAQGDGSVRVTYEGAGAIRAIRLPKGA